VYVDDINIIGNSESIDEARNHLKMEFEMKDLGKTKFCIRLQIEHLHSGILVHQSTYIQKVLEKFNMDKSYPAKSPMVVRSIDLKKDVFSTTGRGRRDIRVEVPMSQTHWITYVTRE